METLPSTLFAFSPKTTSRVSNLNSASNPLKVSNARMPRVSIKPPPPEFDYRLEILEESRSKVASMHPELLDLVDDGSLILIEKKHFGPVPAWRSTFVEPEKIWLIGTNHISERSAIDVVRVARTVRPDNVVVELCRSRAGIMYASDNDEEAPFLRSNMFSLSGTKFLGAIGRSIDLGGQTALALRLLLAVFSSKISNQANRPFGDEFRAARKVSEEIGAQIVLGDRPIEITIERAWNSLNWSERVKLITSLVRGIASPSIIPGNNLKELKAHGSTFQLYQQLSLSCPSLLQPLIYERDTYLAWSLKRSKAVNGSTTVMGVIGKGHMKGVIYALLSDQGNLRYRDLVGKNSPSSTSNVWVGKLLKSLFRDTVIGLILWSLFEMIKTGQS